VGVAGTGGCAENPASQTNFRWLTRLRDDDREKILVTRRVLRRGAADLP
jgi:hypothetical protein